LDRCSFTVQVFQRASTGIQKINPCLNSLQQLLSRALRIKCANTRPAQIVDIDLSAYRHLSDYPTVLQLSQKNLKIDRSPTVYEAITINCQRCIEILPVMNEGWDRETVGSSHRLGPNYFPHFPLHNDPPCESLTRNTGCPLLKATLFVCKDRAQIPRRTGESLAHFMSRFHAYGLNRPTSLCASKLTIDDLPDDTTLHIGLIKGERTDSLMQTSCPSCPQKTGIS
jgi:hypothetical protein